MTFPVLSANGPSGYNLTRSLRTRSSASAYLSRTPASASNRTTWTWSGWVKRGAISSATMGIFGVDGSTSYMFMIFNNSGSNNELDCGELATTQQWRRVTTQVFRDPSAWYHLVLAFDSTQATAANRVKIYVNGTQVTSFSTSVDPSLNYSSIVNTATAHSIGRVALPTGFYLDGYFTEVNFVDGQQLTPSSFGSTNSTTGVWQPAKYGGTYGTNGFYLPFTDNSALTTASNAGLGKDFSGNANYWVTNNISITAGATYDSMTDVPTLTSATAANYCTISPINAQATVTNGNLTVSKATSGQTFNLATQSIKVSTYFEVSLGTFTGSNNVYWGVGSKGAVNDYTSYFGNNSFAWSLGVLNGTSVYATNNGAQTTITTTSNVSSDVWMCAVNPTTGKIWWGKNGSWFSSGSPSTDANAIFSGLPSELFPCLDVNGASANQTADINFGQRPFTYTPPSGFVALNTYNLPASTVPNGAAYMAATTYTGTLLSNTISNAVGSTSFQPDLVWIKSRSAATDNKLTDSVRGVTKGLISNTTGAETTDTQGLTAFGSTGFTVGTNTDYNNLAATYVAWQWKGGGTAVSNTNGSITSSVSANTTSGCSVVTYAGAGVNATVGHGLGVAPSMVIYKNRTGAQYWGVTHVSLTSYAWNLYLQNTDGQQNDGLLTAANSSTVLNLAVQSTVNASYGSYVAYCFAAIKGFSAFGSYTGNGSSDGPFVYCGFRPRWVLVKRTDSTGDWQILDSSRSTYNAADARLWADLSIAEVSNTGGNTDFLSNGFKLRNVNGDDNVSGGTFIYAAFAESPFQNSLAR